MFEVCQGCRLCFKYCDSFPTLLQLIDDKYDGDVNGLDGDERSPNVTVFAGVARSS